MTNAHDGFPHRPAKYPNSARLASDPSLVQDPADHRNRRCRAKSSLSLPVTMRNAICACEEVPTLNWELAESLLCGTAV
jgi:hypothetical protein